MTETTAPARPAIPVGGYFTTERTPEELAEWNRQADAKRASIRASAMLAIGRDPEGRPIPSPDVAEEERLATADLRSPLRAAHQARREIALRLVDQKSAVERAQRHLEDATAAFASLEDAEAAGSRREAGQLAARFRSGEVEALAIEAPDPATSTLDHARRSVEVAQQALDELTSEMESTQRELITAQHRVGLCVLDVVRGELLGMAHQVAEHDRTADALRVNLDRAGYVTATLRPRRNWPGHIFTDAMNAALQYRPPDRSPAPSVDWEDFIGRLYDDAEAELE